MGLLYFREPLDDSPYPNRYIGIAYPTDDRWQCDYPREEDEVYRGCDFAATSCNSFWEFSRIISHGNGCHFEDDHYSMNWRSLDVYRPDDS